jgi:hypothetical protein
MGERLDEFREEASELQDKANRYKNTFSTFGNLFPDYVRISNGDSRTISGKITLSEPTLQSDQLEVAVKIRKFAPVPDLVISLGIEIGFNNIVDLEKIRLPDPSKATETDLDKIDNDDLLDEIARIIKTNPDTAHRFIPLD